MASKEQTESLSKYLRCGLCRELFQQPVILECGHNFCRGCIQSEWEKVEGGGSCPECLTLSRGSHLKLNRALANLADRLRNLKPARERAPWAEAPGGEPGFGLYCSEHREELKLFCETDRQLICVMCLDGRGGHSHKFHDFMLIHEAVNKYKERLKTSLDNLRQKIIILEAKLKEKQGISEIGEKSASLQNLISSEFAKMHQFLNRREESLIRELKDHEDNLSGVMEKNLQEIKNHLDSVQRKLSRLHTKMDQRASVHFLEVPGGSPTCLTLDPNTAHSWLILSDDLTSVRYGDRGQSLPETPERFYPCVCVLASEGFNSGKHYWEVEVGNSAEWDLGVVTESINRKGDITAMPEAGYWIVWLRRSEYKAGTFPRTLLSVDIKPRKIGIYLNYEEGQVSFYNADSMFHLHTFIDIFTEKLYPFFSPCLNGHGENTEPLKICSMKGHYR
ncbi:nuclear factor 7, ovary-like [Hemiscyllium ocellatum]|uniref:nuclear factor 7, ovary-like n=1 Tax=Hemiscyllium ocellatum TaxID=170820 RepID=UPI0029671487|nr:nuclear factor 7, ovary-like [Hemiscyllium ocellatum]